MKNIIKPGSKFKLPIYRTICKVCGCVFEYDKTDTINTGTFVYHKPLVRCPDCNAYLRHKDANKILNSKVNTDTMSL